MTFGLYQPFTLGMDDVFNRLDSLAQAKSNFPPYNIKQVGHRDQAVITLEVALAGISKDRLEVITERGVLTITVKAAEVDEDAEKPRYLHQGLAQRSFTKNFQLASDAVIDSVKYEDGLLSVQVSREVPEREQRKTLPIS